MNKNKSIFVIKQFFIDYDDIFPSNTGFFFNLEDAVKAVEENALDMYEQCYLYTAIIEFKEGLYSSPERELWYKWNDSKNKYIPCEKPYKEFKNLQYTEFCL